MFGRQLGQQESQFGILNQTEPTRCCDIRKVGPLWEGLRGYKTWFTGLRREQLPTRAGMKVAERHVLPTGEELFKVSPVATWKWNEVWAYMKTHEIEALPLYEQGYTSIGCAPCTALPEGDNLRSGRWGGRKLECGIHTFTEARS